MPLIRFGDFELNEQTLEIHRNGALVRIQQQPARVLAFLLNHRSALAPESGFASPSGARTPC